MSVRDLMAHNPSAWLAIGGLLLGAAFGYLIARTNFCAMGSISDIVSFGDYRRFRAWLLAAATAIIGAQALDTAGVVALSQSIYLSPNLNWLGHIGGGLMFGYGMVFAGGCASRNLVRIGFGDLRALMTLIVMGIFAYAALGGLIGPLRDGLERATSVPLGRWGLKGQGLSDLAAHPLGASSQTAGFLAATLTVAALLLYCFSNRQFRGSASHILSGVGVGVCVVVGWVLTGLAFDEMAQRPTLIGSLTFVRPAADAMEWVQRFTAGMVPGFGVATVFGTVLGGWVAARSLGRFKLTSFAGVGDTRRSLFGAALMGVGGVLALGCTVGQGITGLSTLALGSFLTLAAIVAGGVFGMRSLERSLMDDASQ